MPGLNVKLNYSTLNFLVRFLSEIFRERQILF